MVLTRPASGSSTSLIVWRYSEYNHEKIWREPSNAESAECPSSAPGTILRASSRKQVASTTTDLGTSLFSAVTTWSASKAGGKCVIRKVAAIKRLNTFAEPWASAMRAMRHVWKVAIPRSEQPKAHKDCGLSSSTGLVLVGTMKMLNGCSRLPVHPI